VRKAADARSAGGSPSVLSSSSLPRELFLHTYGTAAVSRTGDSGGSIGGGTRRFEAFW
jgi:hypothetical protein